MFKIIINDKEYELDETIICKEKNYFSILMDNKNNFIEEKFNLIINDSNDNIIDNKYIDQIIEYLNDFKLPFINENNILFLYYISKFLLLDKLQKDLLNIIEKSIILNNEELIKIINCDILIILEDNTPIYKADSRCINLDVYNLSSYLDYINNFNKEGCGYYLLDKERMTIKEMCPESIISISKSSNRYYKLYINKTQYTIIKIIGEIIFFFQPIFNCLFKYKEPLNISIINPLINIDHFDSFEKLFYVLDICFNKIKELKEFKKLDIHLKIKELEEFRILFNCIIEDLNEEVKNLI